MDDSLRTRAEQLASEIAGQAKTAEDLNGLMRLMMKSALERMLNSELDVHLGRKALVPGGEPLAVPSNGAEPSLPASTAYKNGKPKPGKPGGTRHDYALAEAFSLKPETIYMLTDGNATESQAGGGLKPIPPQDIYRVAEEGQKELTKKAHLHVIYYLNGQEKSGEVNMLRGLASRNSGKFQKVEAKGRKK
jgi:hypothetical protein